MLRAAENIISTHLGGNLNLSSLTPFALTEIINIARKEAIEECAEIIELFANGILPDNEKNNTPNGVRYTSIYGMYKEAVLKLINDIK